MEGAVEGEMEGEMERGQAHSRAAMSRLKEEVTAMLDRKSRVSGTPEPEPVMTTSVLLVTAVMASALIVLTFSTPPYMNLVFFDRSKKTTFGDRSKKPLWPGLVFNGSQDFRKIIQNMQSDFVSAPALAVNPVLGRFCNSPGKYILC